MTLRQSLVLTVLTGVGSIPYITHPQSYQMSPVFWFFEIFELCPAMTDDLVVHILELAGGHCKMELQIWIRKHPFQRRYCLAGGLVHFRILHLIAIPDLMNAQPRGEASLVDKDRL